MSTLKEATVKSRTYWVNLVISIAGAALVIFQDVINNLPAAGELPPGADPTSIGTTAIVMAVLNSVLRYMTQRKYERQFNE